MQGYELFTFAYFNNFETSIKILAGMAAQEDWDFSGDSSNKNKILKNYLEHTFRKLKRDDGIVYFDNCACFNTGLFTPNYETIYAFFEKNKCPPPNNPSPFFFKGFYKESDLVVINSFNGSLPKRANYFNDPSELIFNTKFPIVENIDHIIEDNANRFPEDLDVDSRRRLLSGALIEVKKKVQANYTIAIPQYYAGKIQLLLPLCLTPCSSNADLALALDRLDCVYRANTCLTVQMAYNNARLIVKPYSSWLKP